MAFPASTALLANVLEQIASLMVQVKAASIQLRDTSAANSVSANFIVSFLSQLAGQREQMAALVATPGLAAYAQAQYNNPSLDIAAEYAATVAQIDATRTWIVNNFPKDGSGNLLERKFDANGRTVFNAFSSASLAPLRTQLDALIATIT